MLRHTPLLAALIATPALAAPFQDTAGLDRAVAAFTGQAIGQPGGARSTIDARMKLAACSTVALSWRTQAQDAVVVACTGPEWRIYVPVVSTGKAVASAAAPARAVAAAPVIKRGDPVTIEAGDASFSITRDGIAMADAAEGGRVPVKVGDARQPVQAVAVAPGRATLPGWGE